MAASTSPQSVPSASRRPSDVEFFFRELAHRPAGLFGLIIILLIVFIIAFGPLLSPYSYSTQDIKNRMQGPSAQHVLGTDHLGRDLAARLIYGTRVALGTAFPAVSIALALGLVLGLLAGYLGGWVDNVLLIAFDTIQAFPAMILALALLSILGPSSENVILAIVVAFTPGYARITRAQVLALKTNLYVEVEKSLGAGLFRILFVHILPNTLPPMLILLAMDLPYGITVETGLSFLGLGVQPPLASWGVILSDGFAKIRMSPWAVIWPSVMLMITTLGFTLFGETVRDLTDPKLIGSRRA
ncbi:MAG TPA: ABC transporter permease [Anaerolineaceae bacterium]|nr:ABC transporter permease [Anaerolineaceae bacterium]